MNKIILNILGATLIILGAVGCSSPQKSIGAYYTYEIECMGSELDGSETVLSWGTGKNKTDGVEQAKKNAVRAILFKGIRSGKDECSKRALLLEVNAEEKYQYYFNTFFKDGGEYKKYVSQEDTRRNSIKGEATTQQEKYGIVVRVLRSELRDRLINDNILKP